MIRPERNALDRPAPPVKNGGSSPSANRSSRRFKTATASASTQSRRARAFVSAARSNAPTHVSETEAGIPGSSSSRAVPPRRSTGPGANTGRAPAFAAHPAKDSRIITSIASTSKSPTATTAALSGR